MRKSEKRKKTASGAKSRRLAGGALFLAAAVGLGVPRILEWWQDEKRTSEVVSEEAEEIRIIPQQELGIADKAELAQDAAVNVVMLERGKNYGVTESMEKAESELNILSEAGVLEEKWVSGTIMESETAPLFYIDSSGERSMILWQIELYLEGNENNRYVELGLDDETGKILFFSIQFMEPETYNGISDGITDGNATAAKGAEAEAESMERGEILEKLAEGFGNYLGLQKEAIRSDQEIAESQLSEETDENYEKEVRLYKKKGYSEEEARVLAGEKWGVSYSVDGSTGGQVVYREEDAEVTYHMRLGEDGISIYLE